MGFARSLSPSAWDLAESVSDISITDDTSNTASSGSDDPGNTADITNTKELATHVRICPHHTLSFQQLQQLASTRLIEEERSLGILKKLYPPHRYKVKDNTKHQSCSQIYFRNSARLEPGFELCASWEAVSSRLRYSDYSKDDMRHMLEGSNVWLCPHIKICNDWVVDAMFFLLKQNDGGHTAKGVKGIRKDCGCCPTAVQVRCLTERPLQELEARLQVNTKRQLGHGLCEDDHDWQDQCPSMTDDERNGSEIDGRREFRCGVQYIRGMIDPEMPSGAQRKLEGEVIRCIRRLGLD